MILDINLCRLARKIKNFVILDLSFPGSVFPEFKLNYDKRYICLPGREGCALEYAGGIAGSGKIVLIYGFSGADFNLPDRTLNVKVMKKSPKADLSKLEKDILEFGQAVLLIPEQD